MKTYDLGDIKKYIKDKYNKDIEVEEYNLSEDNQENKNNLDNKDYQGTQNNQENIYQIKSDKYKKRTVYEVKTKFKTMYDEELLDEIIERFKSLGYINDDDYIKRAVHDFIVLKHLSIFEIKNKLMAKGINKKDIENFISANEDELQEYEINSAKYIANKKRKTMEDIEVKQYLYKKGYREESIREALEE